MYFNSLCWGFVLVLFFFKTGKSLSYCIYLNMEWILKIKNKIIEGSAEKSEWLEELKPHQSTGNSF